jgi:hypothetical protein
MCAMVKFILGYGGEWQDKFDDEASAIARAEQLADEGVSVEVVRRRYGLHSFVTAFPESEREAYRARWRLIPFWLDNSTAGSGGEAGHSHHQYNSIGSHGGGHGGGGHGGHGGH